MPFSTQDITDAGKIGLDFYLAKNPIDQVAIERPLLRKLMGQKEAAPGAKQYIVEQLRYRYQSNFQWFNGAQVVTYNRRTSIEQANYTWRSAHDGFAIDEDRLAQNGIIVTEDTYPGSKTASQAEKIQLTNLIQEQTSILRLGFEEQFGRYIHLDGTSSTDALVGLDALVSTTPTTGTVGGIDRSLAANIWWRNQAATGMTTTTTTGTILDVMETTWRAAVRTGGKPDTLIAGGDFIDGFRNFMVKTYGRVDYQGVGIFKNVEAGTEMLSFHGVPIVWSPEFDDLQDLYAPTPSWKKRCYGLNTKNLRMRPLEGHDMITRKPPRAYDKYEYYWGLTWRGAITMNKANSQFVVSIA